MFRVAKPTLLSRRSVLAGSAAMLAASAVTPVFAARGVQGFVADLWPEARRKGVSRKVFDAALGDFKPLPHVLELSRKQPEFTSTIADYVGKRVTESRVSTGRAMKGEWAKTLAAIEQRYGVQGEIVLGIWGMETNYGGFLGGTNTIDALATLTYGGYRSSYFRDELLTALKIIDEGHITADKMVGSWAGAMGQPQFMPSSFMRYAVDFHSDGHADIWNSVPDALASAANYLKGHGWQAGDTWGYEVTLPHGFDYREVWAGTRRTLGAWASAGVARANGRAFPRPDDTARVFMPMGGHGAVFLVIKNFDVIKSYNNSDSYALTVGHLGDRILGSSGFVTAWPNDTALDAADRKKVQTLLLRKGYAIGTPRRGHRRQDTRRGHRVAAKGRPAARRACLGTAAAGAELRAAPLACRPAPRADSSMDVEVDGATAIAIVTPGPARSGWADGSCTRYRRENAIMQYRKLGNSGAVVSCLALGAMTFGSEADEETSFQLMDAYAGAGGTLIDTADVYSAGVSEAIVGRWLKARPTEAGQMLVASKGRFPMGNGPNDLGLSRRHLGRALDETLRRLGIEQLDLYQMHAFDALTPIEETLRFLDDSVRNGKIAYYGFSNFLGWQLTKASLLARIGNHAPPATLQPQYNLLVRDIEHEIVPAALDAGIGLLPWSPLAGGWLSGKYQRDVQPEGATRLGENPNRGMEAFAARNAQERTWAVIDAVSAVAGETGRSMAQVSLAWLAAQPAVTSVILGARRRDQLADNLDAATLALSDEQQARLGAVSMPQVGRLSLRSRRHCPAAS